MNVTCDPYGETEAVSMLIGAGMGSGLGVLIGFFLWWCVVRIEFNRKRMAIFCCIMWIGTTTMMLNEHVFVDESCDTFNWWLMIFTVLYDIGIGLSLFVVVAVQSVVCSEIASYLMWLLICFRGSYDEVHRFRLYGRGLEGEGERDPENEGNDRYSILDEQISSSFVEYVLYQIMSLLPIGVMCGRVVAMIL